MKTGTVNIDYLGCKLNQAETEELYLDFARAGYRKAFLGERAQVCVLNSCTVTHVADRKSRQWARRKRRKNPSALIVVTGCYAQRAPSEFEHIDEKIIVVDNRQKMGMVSRLIKQGCLKSYPPLDNAAASEHGRTRSLVRIQQGCSNGCTYCIVPLVRKECSSRTPDEILKEVQFHTSAGRAEVVLTGTEIGSYSSNGLELRGLVEMILANTSVKRLRLSSLQPNHLNPSMLGLWEDERLCPHFHISLQSGSDAVLKRMNRKYNREIYIDTIEKVQKSVKNVAITTDVIIGFPGETQADFKETMDLCKEAGFARIHVFPYSPRPMTRALNIKSHIDEKEKKSREKEMLSFAEEASSSFRQKFAGQIMPVLWESISSGQCSGLTPNYIRVYMPDKDIVADKITSIRIADLYRDGVKGEPV